MGQFVTTTFANRNVLLGIYVVRARRQWVDLCRGQIFNLDNDGRNEEGCARANRVRLRVVFTMLSKPQIWMTKPSPTFASSFKRFGIVCRRFGTGDDQLLLSVTLRSEALCFRSQFGSAVGHCGVTGYRIVCYFEKGFQ